MWLNWLISYESIRLCDEFVQNYWDHSEHTEKSTKSMKLLFETLYFASTLRFWIIPFIVGENSETSDFTIRRNIFHENGRKCDPTKLVASAASMERRESMQNTMLYVQYYCAGSEIRNLAYPPRSIGDGNIPSSVGKRTSLLRQKGWPYNSFLMK